MNNTYENQFLSLMEKHKAAIHKVCWMFVGRDDDLVKDLYQEIVMRLWKGFEKYHHDDREFYWVYKISLNTAISYKRKKTILTQRIDNKAEAIPTADDNIYEHIHELISRLDPLEKSIIYLYLERRPYEEIGKIVGISETNVGTKIQRIKQKLKKLNSSI